MLFESINAFIKCLIALDEIYDKGSIYLVRGDFFIESGKPMFPNVKRSNYGKGTEYVDKFVECIQLEFKD